MNFDDLQKLYKELIKEDVDSENILLFLFFYNLYF